MKVSISRHRFVDIVDPYRIATAERKRSEAAMIASLVDSPAYLEAAVQAAEAAGRQAGLLIALLV
ncbi:MAG: hypothetical protein V4675_03680 [Verrucomicrobiota bacterium]